MTENAVKTEIQCLVSVSDASTYAHFLFNAFDTDHNGAVSFEVSNISSLHM